MFFFFFFSKIHIIEVHSHCKVTIAMQAEAVVTRG